MERPGRWGAVRGLLRSCYAEVLPLEGFVRRLQEGARAEGELQPLVQAGDPKCYRSLVEQCVVGLPPGGKPLPPRFTFQQVSSQIDVVARVIQRICEKKKKNVLAFGYALLDENKHQLPCLPNICSYLPNNTTEMVRHNVLWEIILSRVGDDVMMYILEHCALFMLVPPSCCYQICGQPIYELAVRNARPSPRFLKQKYSRQAHSVLFGYLRRKFQSCRQYQAKATKGIWNSRKRTWNKAQEDCNSLCSSVAQSMTGENPAKNKPVIWTGDSLVNQQKPNHSPLFAAPLHKRKRQGQCEISAKRMKLTQKEEELERESRDPVCPESKNHLILDSADSNASERCARSCSVDNLSPVKYLPQRSDRGPQTFDIPHIALDDEFVACEKALKPDRESKTLGESSTNPKVNTRVPNQETVISDTRFVQMDAAKNMTAERGLKTHTSSSVLDCSDKISATATHIERRSLLYCHRQLKEHLPQYFVLNYLQRYRAGGQRLVEVIFLGSKIVKQPGNPDPPSCKWRKKRLPKRYWQMRGVFQELLWNHAKCPYVAMLKKNCPVWVSGADKIDSGQDCRRTGHQESRSLLRVQQANTMEDGGEITAATGKCMLL
ncbi:telomerase reverse transcriptase-like [Tiliqua scincoides]|uniref:telomerase reverse transcriptase-like n=1 Tax=Tiliqua scincoides TaxID=71010 RepID=UPI003462CD74